MADSRNVIQMTLAEAKAHASEPQTCSWLPECLEYEIGFGTDGLDLESTGRLTHRDLYSYVFDSDEVAKAEIYSFDGEDFYLREKYGDRTDAITHILNRKVYGRFVLWLVEIKLDQDWRTAREPDDALVLGNKNGYVAFTDGPEGKAVHVLSPKWMLGFERMFQHHKAIWNDQPVSWVRWANDAKSWEKGGKMVIIKTPDGVQHTIDGLEIAFLLSTRPEATNA